MKNVKFCKKVKDPDCVGKVVNCVNCGGKSRVTRRTMLFVENGVTTVFCPYCSLKTTVENDVLINYKKKLFTFVKSQVSPISSIEDENIRLPMQKLLDDFYVLLQE